MSECVSISFHQFARRNEDIQIHLSNELPNYNGLLCSGDCVMLIYIISGKARFEFENVVYEAQKGDLILVNKEIPFVCTELSDEVTPLLYYNVMFNPSILANGPRVSFPNKMMASSFAFYTIQDRAQTPFWLFKFSDATNSTYGEFFNKMYMEYKSAETGYNDAMMAYLTLIVIKAVRLNYTLNIIDEKTKQIQAINYVQEYINRCYNDYNISVAGLADRVYLNPDYLGRIFKRYTGNSITEALQKKRVEQVCHLLITTDRPINDIAYECGFTDMHFFYKVFKRRMNILPGQYREKTRN